MRSILSFPVSTALTTLALIATVAGCYFLLFSNNEEDEQAYWALMEESDPSKSNASSTPYTATQERHNLHKHMWMNSSGENLQLSVRSENAELVLDRNDESTDVIEHMHKVQCYMQEELYYVLPDGSEAVRQKNGELVLRKENTNEVEIRTVLDNVIAMPMQIVRYMEADAASYYYKNDQLVAEQVTISRFALPGHELKESLENITPLMAGIAQSIEFTIDGNDPKFKAHQFKAILHHIGR